MKIPFARYFVCAGLVAASGVGCMKMDMASTATAREISETTFGNPLAMPPVVDGKSAAFAAKLGTATLGAGITVNALGYAGAPILGATIRVNQSENFSLNFKNDLAEATNIHWHGLEVPAAQDGYPTDVTAPGGSFQYRFQVKNRPGTYWHHPHPDMATASQAYRGLAVFFIVGSPQEDALGLPSGEFDVPLVVQDKRLDGFKTTTDNVRGLMPEFVRDAGFQNGSVAQSINATIGTFSYFTADKA